jgi:trimethylamine:corrinoid methyltransferase-like protein
MAEAIAEDEMQLRSGRLIEYELEPVQNLVFSPESLEIACEFSQHKLKILVGHYCLMGRDSPMDYLSAITVTNANILAALTAVMLLNPDHFGMDYVFAAHGMKSTSEPRHLFGAPHQVLFALASRQLADFYGFRNSIVNAGLSDSCANDFQSGFERGVTAAVSLLCGNDGLGLQGLVGADQAVSLDELIMDDSMLSYLNHIILAKERLRSRPIDVKSIIEAGAGASFLSRINQGDDQGIMFWRPRAFSFDTLSTWQMHRMKGESRIESVREEILASHYPPAMAIPDSTARKLVDVVLQHTDHREHFIDFLTKLQMEIPSVNLIQ